MVMMDKVFYMKRRKKGAISVFLILVFLATYMLSALLVDGGRYRMARAMAESTLDSASQSVLSYYNEMLFDLYGLMALDPESVSEEQIAQVLENYVYKTLTAAGIEDDAYVSTLSEFLLGGDIWADNGVNYFDDFDFSFSIAEGAAGSSVTLASTDYVEDQIIDYMKYRAPLQLSGIDGFLGKLNAIIAMQESLEASEKLYEITKSGRDMFKRGDALQEDIDSFLKEVIGFCNDTDRELSGSAYQLNVTEDLMTAYGNAFHEAIDAVEDMEPREVPTTEDGIPLDPEEIARLQQEAEDELEQEKQQAYGTAKDDLTGTQLSGMFSNAEDLQQRAAELLGRIDVINAEYTAYIHSMDSYVSDSASQEYKKVFEPEVSSAKSQCGEILRGRIPLLAVMVLLENLLTEDRAALEESFTNLDPGEPDEIKAAADSFFDSAQPKLQELCTEVSTFYDRHGQQEDTVEEDDLDDISEPEIEEEEAEIRTFDHPEDLDVTYTQADTSAWDDLLNSLNLDTGDNGKVDQSQIFVAGGNLVSSLLNMMGEGVRDRIYVNEYVMVTFPNIVDDAEFDESSATELQRVRNSYNATNAGVEYILVGSKDAEDNVNGVKARLLGVRTVFNTVAIFTDSAKRSQAAALASAIPCPLTPLLTVVILIAWAVGESAIDVAQLMEGESVPLFKTGGNWSLSIENALGKCVDMAVNNAVDGLGDAVDSSLKRLHTLLDNKANEVIYDVYNGACSTTEAVKTVIHEVTGAVNLTEGMDPGSQAIFDQMNSEIQQAADEIQGQTKAWLTNQKDQAIKKVGDSLDQAFDRASESLHGQIESLGDEAKAQITGKIGEYLKDSDIMGEVTGSSGTAVLEMTYADYLRIFLLLMDQDTKVQRIQSLIQANMNYGDRQNGGGGGFRMEESAVAIWADMECEIRYLFMTNAILPDDVKRQGRMTFTVHSAASY